MKIIVTGSLGHIGRPLTQILLEQGHDVTVISSRQQGKTEIEALKATGVVGSLEDAGFLTGVFEGADAVYCMVPPNYFFNGAEPIAYYKLIGENYAMAIRTAGIKRVVHLSSFGAHLDGGTGLILGSHYVEGILNGLGNVDITHMRPTSFYYNLLSFIGMIRNAGFIAAAAGGDDPMTFVSPTDIAASIAEEFSLPAEHRKIRYVASDEMTGTEAAKILGAAIGKPDLQWIKISEQQMLEGMTAHGMPERLATLIVELYTSMASGRLAEDYNKHKPEVLGKVKMRNFAVEFAAAFNQKP